MNVLVTGGAGFIGSHIVDLLIKEGHTAFVIDDYSSGNLQNIHPEAKAFTFDISESFSEHYFDWAKDRKIDAICHQAAQPSLLASINDSPRDAEVNILGTLHMLELARSLDARFVMASTGAIYPEMESEECRETLTPDPSRPYGISKLAAENYTLFYREYHSLSACILRYGNVYGPRQVPLGENQLVPRALDHAYKGKAFQVYGNGEQTRDFIYVKDVARANLLALKTKQSGIFNICTGTSHTVNEVLEAIRKNTRMKASWENGSPKKNEPTHVFITPYKAEKVLGWKSLFSLKEGIKNTVDWYKEENAIL